MHVRSCSALLADAKQIRPLHDRGLVRASTVEAVRLLAADAGR